MDLGYEILYPLFEQEKAPKDVEKLIHTEIGYQSYEQKKELYRQYPEFYPHQLEVQLKHNYRINEGFIGGLTGSYSSDNFGNDVANVGLLAEWGNRKRNFHTVTAGLSLVQSDVNANTLNDQLTSLGYTYRHNYRQHTMQSMFGAGLSTANCDFFPQLTAGFWIAGGASYTSTQLSYSPIRLLTAESTA